MSVEGILGGDESWGGAHKVVEIFPGIYLVQKCDEEPHTLMCNSDSQIELHYT